MSAQEGGVIPPPLGRFEVIEEAERQAAMIERRLWHPARLDAEPDEARLTREVGPRDLPDNRIRMEER